MNKGDIVDFIDLQIGDYFSDEIRQKYRKISPHDLFMPDQPSITLNAFNIQIHGSLHIPSDSKCIFIKHAIWIEQEKYGFRPTIEESELEYQLDLLDDYLQTIESVPSPEDDDNLARFYEIVHLLRSSFFVSVFSFCETQMNNQCLKSQQDNPDIKILLNDITGKGVQRAKTYLVKVLNSSFPFDTSIYWQKIQWYNKIRNCIVHTEGKVDKDLRKYIVSCENLSCEESFGEYYLMVGDGFCQESLQFIGGFLESLLYHCQADNIN